MSYDYRQSTTQTAQGAQGGNTQTTQTQTAGPLTTASVGASAGSGMLGALVGAAQTVYNIIKDQGLDLQITSGATAAGVSSGIKADDKRAPELAGRFRIAGVWYTHTRVYVNLGQMSHEKVKLDPAPKTKAAREKDQANKAKEFKSAYVASVLPYEITWDLYEVKAPKPMSNQEQSKKRLELRRAEKDLYDKFYNELAEWQADDVTLSGAQPSTQQPQQPSQQSQQQPPQPQSSQQAQPIKFRQKKGDEKDDDYLKFLEQLASNDRTLGLMIEILKEGRDNLKEQEAEFKELVKDMEKASKKGPEFVMANIQIHAVSKAGGVKAKFPQNLKIKANFEINAKQVAPWGFEVRLTWSETATGYGYPGIPGSFHVRQKQAAETDIAVTPNGKLGDRFMQFMVKEKLAD